MKILARIALVAGTVSAAHAASLINLSFTGSMTAIQRQTFVDAAAYWNSVITGYDLNYDSIGDKVPHSLTVNASVPSIDGLNGVLGSAGPTNFIYYDNNPVGQPTSALYYTTAGAMEFDSADVDGLISNNSFYGVVLHEMAHVLGLGTLWNINNNVNSTSYDLYTNGSGRYTGPNALAQWQSESLRPADTFVPVELGGGAGTANGHWNEVDFGAGDTGIVSSLTGMDFSHELMTGWASNTFFVSRTTLGALDDLGYTVDYSKAGVVNYTVVVPECSSLLLVLGTMPLLTRRRRDPQQVSPTAPLCSGLKPPGPACPHPRGGSR